MWCGMEIKKEGNRLFWVYSKIYRLDGHDVENSGLVIFLVLDMLLKISSQFRQSLMWNGLKVIGFWSVRCSGIEKGEKQGEGHTDRLTVYGL